MRHRVVLPLGCVYSTGNPYLFFPSAAVRVFFRATPCSQPLCAPQQLDSWHRQRPNIPELSNGFNSNTPFTRYNRLSIRLYNRFDNRLYHVNKHPTGCQTGCQTGFTTDLTTGCIVYTNIKDYALTFHMFHTI